MRGVLYRTESDGETPLAKPELKVSATKHNRVAYYKDELVKNEAFENGELKEGMIVMTAEDDLSTISSVPVATIITSVSDKAPSGYLLCDGNQYSQTTYPALYLAIGNKYNKEDTSEGYFCVPDLRELVLVGTGENDTQEIADHDVFELGEFKDDQLQDSQAIVYNGTGGEKNLHYESDNRSGLAGRPEQPSYTWPLHFSGRAGTTTRTKQFGVNYFIKATSGELNEDDGVIVQKLMDEIRESTALDYESAVIENWPTNETWTATKRGMVMFTCDLTNWDVAVNYVKKDGTTIMIGGIRLTTISFARGTITFLVSPGDTFKLDVSGAGGPTMLNRLFVPFKVQ